MPCFWTKPREESLALQVHRRELMEAVEAAREPLGFPSVTAMVQDGSWAVFKTHAWWLTFRPD